MKSTFKPSRFIVIFLFFILWQFGSNRLSVYSQENFDMTPAIILFFAGPFLLGLLLFWAFRDKMGVRKSIDAKATVFFVIITAVTTVIILSVFTSVLKIPTIPMFFFNKNDVAFQGIIMLNAILLANCIFTEKENHSKYAYTLNKQGKY